MSEFPGETYEEHHKIFEIKSFPLLPSVKE